MGSRFWNRREFNVAPNGYFTVLRPSGWFSASRLPDGFRYSLGALRGNVPRPARACIHQAVSSPANLLPPQFALQSREVQWGRLVLIVFAAVLITIALLEWIGHPG